MASASKEDFQRLSHFEALDYMSVEFDDQKMQSLAFPRYTSLKNEPLAFDIQNNKLALRQNKQFVLNLSPLDALSSFPHLYLTSIDGKHKKAILPMRQLKKETHFSTHPSVDTESKDSPFIFLEYAIGKRGADRSSSRRTSLSCLSLLWHAEI